MQDKKYLLCGSSELILKNELVLIVTARQGLGLLSLI